ncbi:MAG: hypothetical protein U0R18_00860 [Mycobacterium sp.]
MASTDHRRDAERWFLANGLPAVLRPGVLVRGVLPRSAPALAAFAVSMAFSIVVVGVTGKHTIAIDGSPTRTEWFVLAMVTLVLPVAVALGWAVSRIDDARRRTAIAIGSLVVAVIGGVLGGPSALIFVDLVFDAVVIAVILLCTATGVGSVLGWAARMTFANLASIGDLLVRALPVLLLTMLVFFNSPAWVMAATVGRARLWFALGLLYLIAVAFLMSNTFTRVRSVANQERDHSTGDADELAGTPFEHLPRQPQPLTLSTAERANVAFVLALSQLVQVLTVAVVTGAIFLVFGLILISPELLDAWTHGSPSDGQFLGMTLPIPNALIQISLFLTALTFMYLAAKAVSDKEYRERFVEPLLEDLRLTLVARDRYRMAVAA